MENMDTIYCPHCGRPGMNERKCRHCGGILAHYETGAWLDGTPDAEAASQNEKAEPFRGPERPQKSAPEEPPGTWLDGTPDAEKPGQKTQYRSGAYQNPDADMYAATAHLALQRQEERERARKKVQRVFVDYEAGRMTLSQSIFYFFFDADSFYARADMRREVGRAFFLLFATAVICTVGVYFVLRGMGVPARLNREYPLYIGLFFPVFYLGVSFLGMIFMTIFYGAFASWKRIFGIYGYASVAFCIAWLPPLPFWFFVAGLLFMHFARVGFENVFGLETIPAGILSFGLPAMFVLTALMVIGIIL